MTKKRFIKLCMAHGMQRNEAQKRAENVIEFKSYDELYKSYLVEFTGIKFAKEMKKLGMVISRFASSLECFKRSTLFLER